MNFARDGLASRFMAATAYLIVSLVTSAVAFGVWVTGLSVTLSLAVLIVGLPAMIATAALFRLTATLDRQSAAIVLGSPLPASYRDHRGERFLTRLSTTLRDPQTARDLAWLMLHSVVGFLFGVIALGLISQTLTLATLPVWSWAVDGVSIGPWTVDTVWESFLAVPLTIPVGAITVAVVLLMAQAHVWLATALLAGEPGEGQNAPVGRSFRRPDPRAVLGVHAALTGLVVVLITAIWALAGGGGFWAGWVWLAVGAPLALHCFVTLALGLPRGRRRRLALHGAVTGTLSATAVLIWLLAGTGYFWPAWPLLVFATALGIHAGVGPLWRALSADRAQELEQRVDELTRTRRGAVDVQAAELRRIERDLHDGAQARLVALSMQLGRAEERLADQPEAAELLRQARGEAGAAIAELRDLARGIAPPVLADRGLAAAVDALGQRAAIPVEVSVDSDRRPPPVIETAAYFVVAEALTNVAKHAPGATAVVDVALDDRRLVVEVSDDGEGGADASGGGLTGLRHRVEALDGVLTVASPAGSGTTIRAVFPCES
jgi:signal transduction histidine kinase